LTWRFPGEHLLFSTPCHVDRLPTKGEWALGLVGRAHCIGGACINDPTYRDRAAVLGVTGKRLVYQAVGPGGLLLRAAAASAAVLGVVLAITGSLAGLVWGAAIATALWIMSRVAESFGIGAGSIDFPHIRMVDRGSQTIEGTGHWGTVYRLRIADPSDFGMILAMSGAAGKADAA